jgi:hypothetical protein
MSTKPPFEDPQVAREFAEGRIGSDGVGVPQTYPRMMYKAAPKGVVPADHLLAEKPLKIGGCDVQTTLINDAEEEAIALSDGWFFNPDLKLTAEQAKDKELADLREQVAKQGKKEPA